MGIEHSRSMDPDLTAQLQTAVNRRGIDRSAAVAEVARNTLKKALAGRPISEASERKLLRLIPKTRHATEFAGGGVVVSAPRLPRMGGDIWSLETIRTARNEQIAGRFALPVRLATALRANDALFTAYQNRLAPQAAIGTELRPGNGVRSKRVARRAGEDVQVSRGTMACILGTLVNHGTAVGYVSRAANKSGTRVSMRLDEWPLEHVTWNPTDEVLETATRAGPRVPIIHGDGTWIVFRKFSRYPWIQEAAILPAGLVGYAHMEGVVDWASSSRSHGMAKIIGELPEGVSLATTDGATLTPEAEAFLGMLRDLVAGEQAAAVRPAGSKTEFLANSSTAWQVFRELLLNREKAAARIYLGTDATLGAAGGAPGVDIATLFGVATTKIQGDFDALEQGLHTGLYEPWTAINFGDSSLAPCLRYQMPDPDAAAKRAEDQEQRAELAESWRRLTDTIKALREQGLTVTQTLVAQLADQFGVSPVPQLAGTE